MYLIQSAEFEAKARTEKEVRQWFTDSGTGIYFDWHKLRTTGIVYSDCGRYWIQKIDGRKLTDVEELEYFSIL